MTQAVHIQPPQPFDAKDGIRIAVQMAVDGEARARELSQQQARILNLIVDGLCDKEIGAAMGLQPSGVKYQTGMLFARFGVHSRGEVIAKCLGRR